MMRKDVRLRVSGSLAKNQDLEGKFLPNGNRSKTQIAVKNSDQDLINTGNQNVKLLYRRLGILSS